MKRFLTVCLIVSALIALLGLGTWQVQRLAWKTDLIAQATKRPSLPALSISDVLALPDDERPYRRVSFEGRFIGEHVRAFTTISNPNGAFEGPGYWLMHPFELADGGDVVFVNRGFIPFQVPQDLRVARPPAGDLALDGLVRPNDPAEALTPDPDTEDAIVYRRDIDQMRAIAGFDSALSITIDLPASATDGLPQAGETKFTFSNRHLQYAITWYGLALVLVGGVGVMWWQRRRMPAE